MKNEKCELYFMFQTFSDFVENKRNNLYLKKSLKTVKLNVEEILLKILKKSFNHYFYK